MKRVKVSGLNKKGKFESRILRAETADDQIVILKLQKKLTNVKVENFE